VAIDFVEDVNGCDGRMIDLRGSERLAPQPLAQRLIRAQYGRQRLERHLASEVVDGEIDDAHAAASEFANDPIRTERRPFWKCVEISGIESRGCLEEVAGGVVRAEKRLCLTQQGRVTGARLLNPRRAGVNGLLQSAVEDRLESIPLPGRHPCAAGAESSVCFSQARAIAQCRLTVAGETPMTSAVSSTVRPPK